jgi:molecular chaperone DnaK
MPERFRLKVDRIINEPTAAALAYGVEKKKNEKVAVSISAAYFRYFDTCYWRYVFEVLSTTATTPRRR